MASANGLLGFESQSPAAYEELLDDVTDLLNSEEDEEQCEAVAGLLRKNDYQLARDISGMIRFEESPSVRSAMCRVLGAMAKTDGLPLLEALVAPPCACASWVLGSFLNGGDGESGLEERVYLESDISVHLSFLTMFAVHFTPLPPQLTHGLLSQGGLQGVVNAVLYYQEHDDEADITLSAMQALCALHTQDEYRDEVLAKLTKKETTVIGLSVVAMLNRAGGLHMANCLDLLEHIFSDIDSANFFFVNDLRVVVDICIRQILDLPRGDQLRYMVLIVLFNLLMNCTDYLSILHKNDEILRTLEGLLKVDTLDRESKDVSARILKNCRSLLTMPQPDA